jgi:hypothetical protein
VSQRRDTPEPLTRKPPFFAQAVYQQRGNVLMLSSRDAALDTVDAKLAALGSK